MTFKELCRKVEELVHIPGVTSKVIGHSVLGQPIYAFKVGKCYGNKRPILITAAIHAREWITTLLLIELVKLYGDNTDKNCCGTCIWFVPLCNPDGVQIALDGGSIFRNGKWRATGGPKPLWKANARQVDLNVNFDADWGKGAQNIQMPSSENYIGEYPNSEPEVGVLIEFAQMIRPKIAINYHSKGEVIYYGFESCNGKITKRQLARSKELAHILGKITGYAPIKTQNSTGGFSDWLTLHMKIPAVTVEVGNDNFSHPIGVDQLPIILEQNKKILVFFYSDDGLAKKVL